jgi:hypothetical protein
LAMTVKVSRRRPCRWVLGERAAGRNDDRCLVPFVPTRKLTFAVVVAVLCRRPAPYPSSLWICSERPAWLTCAMLTVIVATDSSRSSGLE